MIYVMQEFCNRDCNDCPDCGGGLDHTTTIHSTFESARSEVISLYEQTAELEKRDIDSKPVETLDSENTGGLKCWRFTMQGSQWYYHIYEMEPCEQCGAFTFHGHIH